MIYDEIHAASEQIYNAIMREPERCARCLALLYSCRCELRMTCNPED